MRIQLWSIYFAPEPTGIGPISYVWARAMQDLGHEVQVIAANPHYPTPVWRRRLYPFHEQRGGVPVLRLPIWAGRSTTATRVRQELSFTASLSLAVPMLGRPDAIVAISPCFPALLPALLGARARSTPLVLWLQDLLPDGATATGILENGLTVRAARRLEHAAYRAAGRIVVLSGNMKANLVWKGVPPSKIVRAYNPATHPIPEGLANRERVERGRVLTMGNIGLSQGLARLVRAFEDDEVIAARGARFVITGDGVAAPAMRAEIKTDRVIATGLVDDEQLRDELRRAQVAIVSQHYEAGEFNVPSKLMNFMAAGLPVVASVAPNSEAARIIRESGCGWVTDSNDLDAFTTKLREAIDAPAECHRRGAAGLDFARRAFRPQLLATRFESIIREAVVGPEVVAERSTSEPVVQAARGA